MPDRNPTKSLAARLLKNDPCPQSWKMMNTRTRNAPASAASGSVSHNDTDTLRYIRYHRNAYGTSVLMICQSARVVEDFWYLATISFQAAMSGRVLPAVDFESFVINRLLFSQISALMGQFISKPTPKCRRKQWKLHSPNRDVSMCGDHHSRRRIPCF